MTRAAQTAIVERMTMSQRVQFRRTPDEQFFADFQAAYADFAAATAKTVSGEQEAKAGGEAERLLGQLMGAVHMELGARRGTTAEDETTYAGLLNRAYASGAMTDPARFLQSLTPDELGVVQRIHCLAEPIDPAGLSREGAYNLLLPEGWCADFDHNDVVEVGAARTLRFPPPDAPDQFLDAWTTATSGMEEMDAATYGLTMFMGLHSLGIEDGQINRTLPADRIESYRSIVSNYLDMLDRVRGMLADGQYERDKEFFGRLQALLG
jgi:hypothetical protein